MLSAIGWEKPHTTPGSFDNSRFMTTKRLKAPVFSTEVARFGLFSRPRESFVEAATKGFGAPSDAFAPNFAMRRRFAAGTFARAIFYRGHQMPFGLKESPESDGLREAPQLVSRAARSRMPSVPVTPRPFLSAGAWLGSETSVSS